jgi:Ca2+-binding EF-hand superfamily protein
MMDQDKDGFVNKEDLKDTFASLGRAPPDKEIDEMLAEASGPINFTMFITLFGDKVAGQSAALFICGFTLPAHLPV